MHWMRYTFYGKTTLAKEDQQKCLISEIVLAFVFNLSKVNQIQNILAALKPLKAHVKENDI